jgi:hypothetical protein
LKAKGEQLRKRRQHVTMHGSLKICKDSSAGARIGAWQPFNLNRDNLRATSLYSASNLIMRSCLIDLEVFNYEICAL